MEIGNEAVETGNEAVEIGNEDVETGNEAMKTGNEANVLGDQNVWKQEPTFHAACKLFIEDGIHFCGSLPVTQFGFNSLLRCCTSISSLL